MKKRQRVCRCGAAERAAGAALPGTCAQGYPGYMARGTRGTGVLGDSRGQSRLGAVLFTAYGTEDLQGQQPDQTAALPEGLFRAGPEDFMGEGVIWLPTPSTR